ncbi:zinc finger protein myoneurin-like 2 [Homarus americanus]|uniref:Zinc finger protein myoneurin-like 2 n=1 Tax=Homarus americanus TaxID=6706 RepID=A0A8J5K4G8_HOMAM|nr:zinc finger protein myoneurin-like 2 [Homarus americanus]
MSSGDDNLVPPTAPLCRACGRHFTCRASLRRHLWIHTGVKPHACHHCPFSCNRRSNLERHVKRHHGPVASEQSPTSHHNNHSSTAAI